MPATANGHPNNTGVRNESQASKLSSGGPGVGYPTFRLSFPIPGFSNGPGVGPVALRCLPK